MRHHDERFTEEWRNAVSRLTKPEIMGIVDGLANRAMKAESACQYILHILADVNAKYEMLLWVTGENPDEADDEATNVIARQTLEEYGHRGDGK